MPPPPPSPHPLSTTIKALTFDVFGTTVSWREHITTALTTHATSKLTSSLPEETLTRLRSLTAQDWSLFAEQWRHSYNTFTRSFVPGQTPWKDIDTHHRDSLTTLLNSRGLAGLYTPSELTDLTRAWHSLPPWPDSRNGLRRLNAAGYTTATLSNGNRSLLDDLTTHSELGFAKLISAEDFRAYKPHPEVYRGTCEMLGCEPGEVALVAAHLGDLAAARAVGMRTVYVERRGEEEWGVEEERYRQAREWVDLWVGEGEGEGGFEEVARRLGA
jgi:2-haloacid dehalogenase